MQKLIALLVFLSSTSVILPAFAVPANANTHRIHSENYQSRTSSYTSSNSILDWKSPSSAHRNFDENPFTRGDHSNSALAQAGKPTLEEAAKKSNPLPAGIPKCYSGTVPFTEYWISKENSWDETNNGERVWLGMEQEERMATLQNETIAIVSSNTYEKCTMEGTCLLNDGRLINVDIKDTFKVIGGRNRKKNLFGYGSRKQNLAPFVSIAVNDLPYGQTLYLSQLDGVRLSNGMIHNGCVRVDDDSYSFGSCQLDFFVVSYIDYLLVESGPISHISFENCTVKNYATEDMMKWVGADLSAISILPNDQRDDWKDWMVHDEEHPFTTTINTANIFSSAPPSVKPSTSVTIKTTSSSVTHSVAQSTTAQASPTTKNSTKRNGARLKGNGIKPVGALRPEEDNFYSQNFDDVTVRVLLNLNQQTTDTMARRYDSRTTVFSPEGRLYQVEYAMESISLAGIALGIMAKDGIVIAAEKKVTSKLLEQSSSSEKIYKLSDNIICGVAGMTADANSLIYRSRLAAQQYLFAYGEEIPVEQLVQNLCDFKQRFTQRGGLRPFGVSFIFAGFDDHHGLQLYHSDPSGNYGGWKATCIGANNSSAQSILKQDYKEDMTLEEAKALAIKVLSKTIDSTTLTSEKVEFATLKVVDNAVKYNLYKPAEIDSLLKQLDVGKSTEEQS
ncbi:hypothetical protein INT44_004988 [Umbelopsis vinacea]|uniref:Proteasome alpha-type subunits domain-containing protein n=1 Tax=Umbelopsis vinacea TaxID=44442 RepID=A0A8H7Q8S8_9FUNG|nr:hypothetical protein INT44_004988 [Umbelopsis vinacea]